ncbi:unnamed protein product [Penicillium salamii]|uniref:Carboxylic ester hydrolase n=1 Tax=Penicillium salamii TaxID=1612424 RepID=A0A9W4NI12_9EURO|nr:unnamed protein product [Penicillium salamii]
MRLACITFSALNVLVAVQANFVSKSSSDCDHFLNVELASGYRVSNSTVFPPGSLNSSGIVNEFTFCRVEGTIHYDQDVTPVDRGPNTLTWNLYLPAPNDYNGRFMAVGNGGYAGDIDEASMMTQLNFGYAVAGCDSGHSLADSGNSTYAPFLANNAQVKAWIHNSIAMTTKITRNLTTQYYNETPAFSYYYGCSTGGAQGYALAQFHPEIFDGIYAGCPGNWYSHLMLSFLWNGLHTQGSGFMSQEVLKFITENVISACDSLDGAMDGLIENPLLCGYDIAELECASGQNPTNSNGVVACLTSDQLTAAQAIYQGPKNAINGEEIYPGMELGSESSWLLQETTLYTTYAALILKELVFNDLTYNISTFDWVTDVQKVDQTASPLIDAISPDLSAFHKRGGRMITTQGWADQFNAPLWPIQHRDQIQKTMKEVNVTDFIEIFMIPGGGHCGANPAYPHVPATYHILNTLVPWVEKGVHPAQILTSDPPGGSNTTRKLCAWPKNARYVVGDIDDWASYDCV